jgi:plasmid maintenance system killer protein
MEIEISDNSLRKALEDDRKRVRKFGPDIAAKIAIRMTSLLAAKTLADLWPPFKLPERCHELKGTRKGVFSIDLKHPFRLLFRPINTESNPERPDSDSAADEQERWKNIREIEVIGIEDTHA